MSGQPNPLRREEWHDEARREQQADERIRELKEEVKRLREVRVILRERIEALKEGEELFHGGLSEGEEGFREGLLCAVNHFESAEKRIEDALDGGGENPDV